MVAEPTFEAVLRYAKIPAARPVKVPLTADYRHDLPAMAARCSASTGLVYVCNPNNPTGTIVRRAELLRFIEAVPETVPILIDEAYHDFVEDPEYPRANRLDSQPPERRRGPHLLEDPWARGDAPRLRPRVAVADRVDEGATSFPAARTWRCSRRRAPAWWTKLTWPIRRAATTRPAAGSWESWREEGLEVMDSHTNFVMVRVGSPGGVRAAMKQRGILVGRDFPPYSEWLRVSIGTPSQMQAFMTALREWRGKKVA